MRLLKLCIYLLLLVTTPTLLAVPTHAVASTSKFPSGKLNKNFKKEKRYQSATYDEILVLLDEIESGKAEKKYSSKDLKRINKYLAYLAEKGMTPGVTETTTLRSDIACLLNNHKSLSHYDTCFIENLDIIAAKSWFSSGWKNTKNFTKKHKKAIIIGAVIVVATAAIVISVGTASPGAVSAIAGAAGAGGSSIAPDQSQDTSTEPKLENNITEQVNAFKETLATYPLLEPTTADSHSLEETGRLLGPIFAHDAPIVKATVDEHVASFREFLAEDAATQQTASSKRWDELSFGEKAREMGASFTHQALEEVSDLVKVVPELCEEIKELGTKFLPDSLAPPSGLEMANPMENYEYLATKGHEIIDKAFSTDQAHLFTAEAKANNMMNDFAIGVIPVPGIIYKNGTINVNNFSRLGKVSDRAGYTKAGRGSMKHGYREGRTVFEKPIGNPTQINNHGQRVLDEILNHPEKKLVQYSHDVYGPVIEIEAPEIGGVRFTGDGKEMMGFLEPKWFKK